jgi:hypothetical protein
MGFPLDASTSNIFPLSECFGVHTFLYIHPIAGFYLKRVNGAELRSSIRVALCQLLFHHFLILSTALHFSSCGKEKGTLGGSCVDI